MYKPLEALQVVELSIEEVLENEYRMRGLARRGRRHGQCGAVGCKIEVQLL